ncbi:MAG: hypothetical protein R3A10_08910 [Caldilineaceae bacterium]
MTTRASSPRWPRIDQRSSTAWSAGAARVGPQPLVRGTGRHPFPWWPTSTSPGQRGRRHAGAAAQLIARGLGWDYQEIKRTLKTSNAAQGPLGTDRDHLPGGLLRRFVDGRRNGTPDVAAVEAYLQEQARLEPACSPNSGSSWPTSSAA